MTKRVRPVGQEHAAKESRGAQPRERRRVARLGWLLRGLVSAALILVLLQLVDIEQVGRLMLSASPAWLIAALLTSLCDRGLMVAKWYPLLRVQTAEVPLLLAGRAYLASGIAQYLLPASVGADALRMVVVGRRVRATVEVGASIVAERVLGLIALAIMSTVALLLAVNLGLAVGIILPWALAAAIAGLAALLIPMSSKLVAVVKGGTGHLGFHRLGQYVDRFGMAYGAYRGHPGLLLVAFVLTLIEQLFPVAVLWLLALALKIPVGLTGLLVVVPLTLFVLRLPVSFGGLGVGEGATVYLLGLLGVSPSEALALSLTGRVIEVLVNAGPAVFLWSDLARGLRFGKVGPAADAGG